MMCSRLILRGALLFCVLSARIEGQFIPVVDCPVEASCCEEDCCGNETSWDSEASYCLLDFSSDGFNGTYSDEYENGCVERVCCESSCCSDGTVYDSDIQCCVPTPNNIAYLNLFQKDPANDFEIVERGAYGKMKYNLGGPEFVFDFEGHGLEPGTDYMLMYFPDPWPGTGLICFGSGTIDKNGKIYLQGSVNTGNLPAPYDTNSGAKIWLALLDDVKCGVVSKMRSFSNQTEYLFEETLITFIDTDDDESDRLLLPGESCSADEQCQTGICYESEPTTPPSGECAQCNPETSLGCIGSQVCQVSGSGRPFCEWPDDYDDEYFEH